MAHVPPPPTLIIRPHRANLRWREWSIIGLFWFASLLVAVATTWILRENVPGDGVAQLKRALEQNAALLQRVAVLERAQQVANAASADLQRLIGERQEEIAGLRSDLAFYSSLTRADSKRDGLSVQSLGLTRLHDDARVFDFAITLTQNLKPGQVASGRVRLSISGTSQDKLATLEWADLVANGDPKGMAFSFKYFQQIKGTLQLPAEFAPHSIRVEADGAEFGKISHDFTWQEVLSSNGETHAGQSK